MRFAKVRTTDTVIGDTAAATRDTATGAAADNTLSPNCAHRARHAVSNQCSTILRIGPKLKKIKYASTIQGDDIFEGAFSCPNF
jgi:hypothetical protein